MLSTSAQLADDAAGMAVRAGNAQRAALERSHQQQAARAAEQGRRAARRYVLCAQADRPFSASRRWRGLFNGEDSDGLLVSGLAAAVIGTDAGGTVALWNRAAERLYGWTRGEALGRAITALTVAPKTPGSPSGSWPA